MKRKREEEEENRRDAQLRVERKDVCGGGTVIVLLLHEVSSPGTPGNQLKTAKNSSFYSNSRLLVGRWNVSHT